MVHPEPKTLLAKAIAGEAGVPFYAVSDQILFKFMWGRGPRLESYLKSSTGWEMVIFIDEIDALGKKRDGGLEGGGNDERDQTLNALRQRCQVLMKMRE